MCKQNFHALSKEEITDPYLVIHELFDFADLADTRELLWNWLKTTVTGDYHKQLTATERSTILTMYEKMEKLIEAAYLLQEQSITKNGQAKNTRRQRK